MQVQNPHDLHHHHCDQHLHHMMIIIFIVVCIIESGANSRQHWPSLFPLTIIKVRPTVWIQQPTIYNSEYIIYIISTIWFWIQQPTIYDSQYIIPRVFPQRANPFRPAYWQYLHLSDDNIPNKEHTMPMFARVFFQLWNSCQAKPMGDVGVGAYSDLYNIQSLAQTT